MQTDILVSSKNLSWALSACLNKPKPCFDKHYYIFINVSNLIMLTSGNHVTIVTESELAISCYCARTQNRRNSKNPNWRQEFKFWLLVHYDWGHFYWENSQNQRMLWVWMPFLGLIAATLMWQHFERQDMLQKLYAICSWPHKNLAGGCNQSWTSLSRHILSLTPPEILRWPWDAHYWGCANSLLWNSFI